MSAHVDIDGDCPLAVVPCQYNDIGCKHKVRMVRIVALCLITICLEVRLHWPFYNVIPSSLNNKHHHSVRVPL